MDARDQFKIVQTACGLSGEQVDGIPGEQSAQAFRDLSAKALAQYHRELDKSSNLIASPGWKFKVEIDGDDLWVRRTTSTWFGGDSDPLDNGETASGYPTKGHPELIACSLPMPHPKVKATQGSPIPLMPFGLTSTGKDNPKGAHVDIFVGDKSLMYVPVIDIGPAKSAEDALDSTVAVFKYFGISLKQGVIKCDFRIPGGAKYL